MALATTPHSALIPNSGVYSRAIAAHRAFRSSVRSAIQTDATLIFMALALGILQIADGVLTAAGIAKLGTAAEGNIMLRALMEAWGTVPALVIVKLLAIAAIIALTMLASQVKWIKEAMTVVVAVYLFAAIIPWSYIHAAHLF